MLGSSPSYRGYDTRCILQPPAIAAIKHEVLARAGDTPDDAPGIGTEGAEIAVVAVRIAEMGAAPGAGGEVEIVDAIGRESCRDRVCHYVSISVVAVSLKKQTHLATC